MFNERQALEQLFRSLEQARERRYSRYLSEIEAIEKKERELLESLRRIDEDSHIHQELIQQKKEEMAVASVTKKNLAAMEDTPRFKDEATAKKFNMSMAEPAIETKGAAEPSEPLKKALAPVYEDHKRTWPDGSTQYQTYYICPSCKDRGRIYINSSSLDIYCRNCKKKMKTKHATSKGFPVQDTFGNYFVAGDFVRVEDRGVLIASNPVDQALAKYEAERAEKEAAGTNETAIAAALKESAQFNLG